MTPLCFCSCCCAELSWPPAEPGRPVQKPTRRVELEPLGGGTGVLEFSHVGLIPKLSCFEVCEHGWEHFLRSLVDYAEQGAGTPF